MSTETYEYEKINAKDKPIAEDFVYVYSEIEDGGFRKVSKAMLKVLLGVATKLSELENDKAFITKTVLDLENYYSKSETYSKDEIDNRISLIPRFDVQVVSSLPTTNISETTVYLVSSGDDSDNLYTEYINVNGLWEILGTQKIASVENAVLYTEQSLTEEQKTQARTNISAASSEEVRQLEEQIDDQNTRISEAVDTEFENEKSNIVQLIIEELGGLPVFGTVDENNIITVTSELSDGTYTLMYENEDGTTTEIGTIIVGTGTGEGSGGTGDDTSDDTTEPDTTLTWSIGAKIDSSTGTESTSNNYWASNYFEVVDGYTYTLNRTSLKFDCKVCYYDESKNFLSTSETFIATDGETTATIPLIDNAKYFRLRAYYGSAITEGSVQYESLMSATVTATK